MSLQLIGGIFLVIMPVLLITGYIRGLGKRSDFYESILVSSGSVLVSSLLYLKAYSMIAGRSPFDTVWDFFRLIFQIGAVNTEQILTIYHDMGIFKNFTTAEQLVNFMIGQMKQAIPAFLLISSMIYGMFLFFVIRYIFKRLSYDTPVIPPFEEWRLPRGMGFGLIILLLASFIGKWMDISNFEVVQLTVTALFSFLFTVLGLSVLWFFLKAGRVPAVIRWLLAILAMLIVSFVLPILGMLDHLFQMRLNYRNKFLVSKK
jgi:hypothetical protein